LCDLDERKGVIAARIYVAGLIVLAGWGLHLAALSFKVILKTNPEDKDEWSAVIPGISHKSQNKYHRARIDGYC
jgi:hypothetical protein